jgi:hypothetical protein
MRKRFLAASLVALLAVGGAATIAGPASAADFLRAHLTGRHEIPNGDPNGLGHAEIRTHPTHGNICFRLRVWNIQLPATAAHIHYGTKDENGPVVVTLSGPHRLGRATGCRHVGGALVKDIENHPWRYYVNVHTGQFPDGAIRGQLHG